MPIKGLQTRAAVLGHIKIGGREKRKIRGQDRIIPVKFDQFVVTTNEQDELGYIKDDVLMRKLFDEQLAILRDQATEKIYGERPARDEKGNIYRDENGAPIMEQFLEKTIQHTPDKKLEEMNQKLRSILVALPFDDIHQNLVTSLSVYDREGCRCRGDGEVSEWVDPRSGEVTKVHCPCQMLMTRLSDYDDPDDRPEHHFKNRGMIPNQENGFYCKANGVLRVKIAAAKTLGGVHLFRTTSMNSIRQLMSAMEEVSQITGGVLSGIPLVFEVDAKKVKPFHNKPPQKAYVVNLTYKASALEFLKTAIEQAALREKMKRQLASAEIALLPAPGYENVYEQVAIAQEFYSGETPKEYIDVTADQDVVDAAPEDEAPPPTDDDAPDAEVKDKPKKGESKAKSASKRQQKPEEKPQAENKAAQGPEEAADAPKTEKVPVESGTDSAPQEAAQAPSEDKASAAQTGDPQQGSLLDEDDAAASGSEAAESAPVDTQEGQGADTADSSNGDGAAASQKDTANGFPDVILDKPDGADTKPASKELRKEFFSRTRKLGFKDADTRKWCEELWEAKTSAALRTWQVQAMLEALE